MLACICAYICMHFNNTDQLTILLIRASIVVFMIICMHAHILKIMHMVKLQLHTRRARPQYYYFSALI